MKPSSAENQQWFYRTFADQFARVVEMMTGEAPLIESSETDPPTTEGHTIFESSLNLAPGAVLVAATPENTWKKIGERILAIAGLNDQEDSELRNTFKEAVDQAISGVANAAGSRIGREVLSVTSKVVSDFQGEFAWASIEIVLSEDCSVPLLLGVNEIILNAIDLPETSSAAAVQRPPGQSAEPAAAAAAAAGAATPQAIQASPASAVSKSVEILLDVELPVCVSFGRAQLLLKDVLKLNTGSIVELNRTVNEPVEIVVNGSVIARGEVVVVEGNFGVRIQSVISRQERIRTLH